MVSIGQLERLARKRDAHVAEALGALRAEIATAAAALTAQVLVHGLDSESVICRLSLHAASAHQWRVFLVDKQKPRPS